MNTRLSDLASKISDWSAASAAQFAASTALTSAASTLGVLQAFQSDLCS